MTIGRPRDSSIDDKVLEATHTLLSECGYAKLRIDHIASASGIAKTTIYRRWPTLNHLVVATISRAFGTHIRPPSGDIASDLTDLLVSVHAALNNDSALLTLALDIHRHDDPQLRSTYRSQLIDPLRNQAISLVHEGIVTGIFREDLNAPDLVDAAIGAMIYRLAILHEPMDDQAIREFAASLLTMGSPQPPNEHTGS